MYIHTFAAPAMTIEQEIKTDVFKSAHHRAIVNLTFTHSWLQLKHVEWLKPHGLSIQQFNILRILRGRHPEPASVSLLIDRMVDKNSNASRLVEKLRVKKLVKRRANEADRRQVDIFITRKGLNLLSLLDDGFDQFEETFHHLTEEEANTLSNLLDKLRKPF